MYPNGMMYPMGMYQMVPMMVPQMAPMPMNIRIDVTPMNNADGKSDGMYSMPQVTVYTPESGKVDLSQTLAAQAGVKVAENKPKTEAPKADKKEEVKPEPKSEPKQEVKQEVKHNRPEIVAPEPMKNAIDINGLNEILNSPDYEEQADAMEAIAEVVTYAPERAGELLDKKVVDALTDIMEKDTSSLSGDDKKLADRNKEYAMFTTATLQRLYSDEVKKEGNVVVPTEDLIGIKSIVKNLATNPNASIREAAVASLGYVSKPEHKQNLSELLKYAAQDSDAGVRAQANKQMQKVSA
ncbi:hypothetical protein IKE67_01135 [bacterium]|nr:hypothetical protein [bacterium]